MASEYRLKMVSVTDETPDTKTFSFDIKGKGLSFIPGQYYALSAEVPGKGIVTRFYSVASSPTNAERLEFQIKLFPDGALTPFMFNQLKAGSEMLAKGPFGKFTYAPEMGKKLAFIGAGSGLAPLHCIAQYNLHKKLDTRLTLIYSNKTEADIIARQTLDGWAREHKNFRLFYTITRENPPGWKGFTRRIDAEMIKSLIPDYLEHLFYICGAPEFVKHMKETLLGLGVEKEKVKVEVYD